MSRLYACKARARALLARWGLRRRRKKLRDVQLLEHFGIDVVFDVGANAGQYARRLQSMGYRGRIVSFEPVSSAYDKLQANAWANPRWQAVRLALGAEPGEATMHVSGNSQSSSLLPMMPAHVAAARDSAYVGHETVPVDTLAAVIDQYARGDERCFLKLDVQGTEHRVLAGAGDALPRFCGVQLEMALVSLYDGEMLFWQLAPYMQQRGYGLVELSGGFADDRTGRLLQVDGIFYRDELMDAETPWKGSHVPRERYETLQQRPLAG